MGGVCWSALTSASRTTVQNGRGAVILLSRALYRFSESVCCICASCLPSGRTFCNCVAKVIIFNLAVFCWPATLLYFSVKFIRCFRRKSTKPKSEDSVSGSGEVILRADEADDEAVVRVEGVVVSRADVEEIIEPESEVTVRGDGETKFEENFNVSKPKHRNMKNYLFYTNQIPSKPNGDLIDNIHEKWFKDYQRLESHHGFIQWLFPLREPGVNWEAQVLNDDEIEDLRMLGSLQGYLDTYVVIHIIGVEKILKKIEINDRDYSKLMLKDEKVRRRMLTSYKLMLDFYGLVLVNDETGEVARSDIWESRFKNLKRNTHNNLRISRIFKCLGIFQFDHLRVPLMKFFLEEILVRNTLSSCEYSCINFWMNTFENDEYDEICQYKEHLEAPIDDTPIVEIVNLTSRPDETSQDSNYSDEENVPTGDSGLFMEAKDETTKVLNRSFKNDVETEDSEKLLTRIEAVVEMDSEGNDLDVIGPKCSKESVLDMEPIVLSEETQAHTEETRAHIDETQTHIEEHSPEISISSSTGDKNKNLQIVESETSDGDALTGSPIEKLDFTSVPDNGTELGGGDARDSSRPSVGGEENAYEVKAKTLNNTSLEMEDLTTEAFIPASELARNAEVSEEVKLLNNILVPDYETAVKEKLAQPSNHNKSIPNIETVSDGKADGTFRTNLVPGCDPVLREDMVEVSNNTSVANDEVISVEKKPEETTPRMVSTDQIELEDLIKIETLPEN